MGREVVPVETTSVLKMLSRSEREWEVSSLFVAQSPICQFAGNVHVKTKYDDAELQLYY